MLNLDTHMLVYLLSGRLTSPEKKLVESEELAVSGIALWELAKLVQLGRLELDFEDEAFRRLMLRLTVLPISLPIAIQSTRLDFRGDPADEIIAATSIVEDIPLLTRDRAIRKSRLVPLAN